MDVADITVDSVAKAVNGTATRKNSVLCCCPVHEASGTHNPSLILTITKTRNILFHCRSQNCDAKQFRTIRDHLIKCGLPASHVGGNNEVRFTYSNLDGSYAWTKTRYVTKSGKKRFRCETFNATTHEWTIGRPAAGPSLYNLSAITNVIATYPNAPLLIVEGEKDVETAGSLGVLATTCADGAGKWSAENTQALIKLGVRKIIVCPDNDGPGVDHGIRVATMFQQAGVEVRWLELPELGPKEDLSDWAPKQTYPDAQLKELMEAVPLFDAEAFGWRAQLKMARPNAGCTYRGDIPNISLTLKFEPRLQGCFAWNDFRHRVEVVRKTPWCLPEWWEVENLTPIEHRALRDADIAELGNYLTRVYDFGACGMQGSRSAIHTAAEHHIFDELKDRIGALPDWDGVKRCDTWLMTYAGANPEVHSAEYLALVGSKYLMQVLNRALHPGAKADYSLIFTALQGVGKDLVLEAMFSPYYCEGIPPPSINPADFARGIAGAIVAHAAEMSAWRKADVDERKATLTRCVDKGRPAYGYETRTYPRRTCFAFSLNDAEFLQDATGDRRYWPVSTIRDRVNIEGLRRDRDQLLAEALARLKGGELHWPTWEEEQHHIAPERQKYMPEVALEILAILHRFITEEPQCPRPRSGDLPWKWSPRSQPLRELHLDAFFEKCFGMYAAVRRQGLDRASKRDIAYCTTWLRQNDWRRVQKHLPDGQRVVVWRTPDPSDSPHFDRNPSSELGSSLAKSPPETRAEGASSGASAVENCDCSIASVGIAPPKEDPTHSLGLPKIQQICVLNQSLRRESSRKTQKCFFKRDSEVKNFSGVEENFTFEIALGKVGLGLPCLDGLSDTPLDALEEAFPRDRFLALDVETTGLSAGCDGLRTVQFSDGETVALMVFQRPVPARALVVLADFIRGRRVVAHNARFEASWFHLAEIDLVFDDTVLLFSAVRGTRAPKGDKRTSGGRVSLAALAAMVLNETVDKSEQTSDWAAPTLTDAQLVYALNDAVLTYRVWDALRTELHSKRHQCGVDIAAGYEDLRFSAAMAHRMERAGVGFDVVAHQAWVDRKREPVAAIEAYLATLDPELTSKCLTSGPQLDQLFRRRFEHCTEQVKRLVLRKWPKTAKTRKLSFARECLAEVLKGDYLPPDERHLIETLYVRADQLTCLATFGEGFSTYVVDGRLHGQLHAGGAVTGRYTSTDPSLQNIPTDKEFRGFFCAPAGRVLVDVDYSQLELRVFAALSGDAKMIAAFEAGCDYHDLVVQRLGCTRRQAKAINFGIIFGMSVATLAVELGVDEIMAAEYLRGWEELAPTGAAWRSDRPYFYRAEQGVRTARRWIDYLDDEDAEISANTRPMNYPVQGGAADVMHRAMRLLFEHYRDWPGHAQPVLTVHDEVLVEADVGVADQVGALLAEVMVEAFHDVLPNGPTRFLAIPGVGSTWAAAKADGEAREKALRQAGSAGE